MDRLQVSLDSTGEFSSEQAVRLQEKNFSQVPRHRADLCQMEITTLVELGLHAFILHFSTSSKIVDL